MIRECVAIDSLSSSVTVETTPVALSIVKCGLVGVILYTTSAFVPEEREGEGERQRVRREGGGGGGGRRRGQQAGRLKQKYDRPDIHDVPMSLSVAKSVATVTGAVSFSSTLNVSAVSWNCGDSSFRSVTLTVT